MKPSKLPLAERMERVSSGRPAYPEWTAAAIRELAQCPIPAYMDGCSGERERLRELLRLRPDADAAMTYEDMATAIYLLRLEPGRRRIADETAKLLAAPIIRYHRERRAEFEQPQKNTP